MLADGVRLDPALERLYGEVPPGASLVKLRGDASTRSYYRVRVPDATPLRSAGLPRSVVVMRLPEDALGSDEATGADRPRELPFVDVQRLLASRGMRVPRIFVDDAPGRVLLLEDLGDETLGARLDRSPREAWPAAYARAVDLLVAMHDACKPAGDADASVAFRRRFDRALLRWELDHFREWGLEALSGPLPDADRRALDAAFDALADATFALPTGFVHRDYQSRNLMLVPPDDALCVIDFQDALVGPYCYDLVALTCDSYVSLDADFQRSMMRRYAERAGRDPVALERDFWLVAAQRKLKDAGRFVFIDRVRENPDFLRWFPRSLRYVGRALGALDGFGGLEALLGRLVPGFPDTVAVPNSAR